MFGRLATVRIKAAEDALAAGRLDDAYQIASARDLLDHPRVRRLRSDLAAAYLKRGQEHMLGKRFTAAAADFDRCAHCSGSTEKVAEWQRRAREAIRTEAKDRTDQAVALAEARERLNAGSLRGAADALARSPEADTQAGILSEEIGQRDRRARAALDAATEALKQGRIAVAIEKLRAARALHRKLEGLDALESELLAKVLNDARQSFRAGRLDRAGQDIDGLKELGAGSRPRRELEEAMLLAADAAQAVADDRYARASVLLGRLAHVSPEAQWISGARSHLETLDEHRRALLEGPLGLALGRAVPAALQDRGAASDETLSANATGRPVPPPVPAQAAAGGPGTREKPLPGLPRRLLLRIDGVGSYLLLRGDRIGIGRAGPGATADLQLLTDLAERQAEIVRAGEDYFLVAQTGVELAGRQVDHALLEDGDRLRLTRRVRLTFRRPSLKSTTAVLDLGDGVRTTTDCRRVMLWSGPLLMGSTRECHIPLGRGTGEFVLMERGGRLYIKPMRPGGSQTPVTLGEQMAVASGAAEDDLRFSVTPWSDGSQTGGVFG